MIDLGHGWQARPVENVTMDVSGNTYPGMVIINWVKAQSVFLPDACLDKLAHFVLDERGRKELAAVAPELLAALKEVVNVSDRATDIYDRAHAAIAKAERVLADDGGPVRLNEGQDA